jgi:streptogramin lyase
MSQDFVTQLQLQLRDAALREERRTPAAQHFARARRSLPGGAPLAIALAVALLAVAVAIGALKLRGEPEPVKPRTIQTFSVSNGVSSIAYGSGSVWVADAITGDILRIDPRTHKITARIRSKGEPIVATGAGAVWALGGDLLTSGALRPVTLARIDPRTNRVVATIPVRTPTGENLAPLFVRPDGDYVWVCGAAGALRIDPRRNAPDRYVSIPGQPADIVAEGERVWALSRGGRLRELDARTGRVVTEHRLPDADAVRVDPSRPGTLLLTEKTGMRQIDRATGRTVWRASLDGEPQAWIPDGDALWVFVARSPAARDLLVRLDAETGHPTGQVALPGELTRGMAKVGRDVWVTTPIGAITVVR